MDFDDEFDLEERSRRAERVKKDLAAHKTEGGVFNRQTLESVGKLGSEGHIDRLMGPIATGKEADVFLGEKGEKKIVVKIFRLLSASYFKKPTFLQYIQGDRRFKDVKQTPSALILAWVTKEFRNLKKAEELSINAPTPIAMEGNVIVMSYIGKDKPSLQLLRHDVKDAGSMFKEVVAQIKKLYKGGLVHADLSEYNILVRDEKPFLIDFGQAVPLTHPKAGEFLERDVINVCRFFEKRGVECDPAAVLKNIVGKKPMQKKEEDA